MAGSIMKILICMAIFLTVNEMKSVSGFIFGFPRGNMKKCPPTAGARPFYFGKTDLLCMNTGGNWPPWRHRGKRRAPSRFTFDFSHRWVNYGNMFLEFGQRPDETAALIVYDLPKNGDKCKAKIERRPAGYSVLSMECVKRCVQSYVDHYGGYNFNTNNCHHFTNNISQLLCLEKTCPEWCKGKANDSTKNNSS